MAHGDGRTKKLNDGGLSPGGMESFGTIYRELY